MPRPVQPNKGMVEEALKQMGSITRVTNKKGKFMPLIQTIIGTEKMDDNQLAENGLAIVDAVTKVLPRKHQNIKSIYLKESMGPSIRLGPEEEAEKQ